MASNEQENGPKLADQQEGPTNDAKKNCSCSASINFGYLISISMILVGGVYFDSKKYCPAENIAQLLIIGGVFSLFGSLASQMAFRSTSLEPSKNNVELSKMEEVKPETVPKSTSENQPQVEGISPVIFYLRILATLLNLAIFCVFISTSVLVFRLYPNVDYENKGDANNYCTRGLFLFAFTYLVVIYILLFILICCCLCCCTCTVGAYCTCKCDKAEGEAEAEA